MTTLESSTSTATAIDQETAERLSEALADVFRRADTGDVFTPDLFLDGHPPYWRFQLEGVNAFGSWLGEFAGDGVDTEVVGAIPTQAGFVTEFIQSERSDSDTLVSRKLLMCRVESGRISELVIYCSGDWDSELRARHDAEAPLLRP